MVATKERRRLRNCASCWSDQIVRGTKVEGMAIPLGPGAQNGGAGTAPVYANVCCECGMVTLFVRISELSGMGGQG